MLQDKIKNGHICLSGGGNEKQSFLLDKLFFAQLPKNSSLLYIPTALRGNKLYESAHLWMKSILNLHNRVDIKLEAADDLSDFSLKDLKKFAAIYIGGGNTWNLMKELVDSNFSQKLIEFYTGGGYIYGGSAGAIVLGKNINTQNDKKEINLKSHSGLNLLENYSVACHFRGNQSDQFKAWAISHKSPILCLPEETGLFIKDNVAICVGLKPCKIYFADGKVRIIKPEESFNLK